MSSYIKLATSEYPRHQGDIRLEHPEIGNDFVCPNTYAEVLFIPPPEINYSTQTCYELPPQKIDGQWTMVWAVRDLTEEEKMQIAENIKKFGPKSPQNTDASGSAPNVI